MNNLKFEQMLSHRIGNQPTLRDMIFDYYCGQLADVEKANEQTNLYIGLLWNKVAEHD